MSPQNKSIMMIRFSSENCHRSVNLFDKEQSDHFMRKCHSRQRNLIISPIIDSLRKAIWSANHKHKIPGQRQSPFLYISGKLARTKFFSSLIQKHDKIPRPKGRQQKFSFSFFLTVLGHRSRILHIGNCNIFKRHIMFKPLNIPFRCFGQSCIIHFPNTDKLYLQNLLFIN